MAAAQVPTASTIESNVISDSYGGSGTDSGSDSGSDDGGAVAPQPTSTFAWTKLATAPGNIKIMKKRKRRPAEAGAQSRTHTTAEASDDTHAGELARAGGDCAAAGASRGTDKKCTREAGSEQAGGGDEARSETNDATATVVEQTPLLRIPAGTPAHVTNKRHKSTASVTDIFHS